jgi:hypothetical protein
MTKYRFERPERNMALVEYAGKDDDDLPFSEMQTVMADCRDRTFELFRLGYDTYSIANIVKISEGEALRLLTIERCNRKFLPSPYGVQS